MTSTVVWRWLQEDRIFLYINGYASVALVTFTFFQQKPKTGKEKCKETFGQIPYSRRGKKANYKIEGKHPSPQINKKTKWKSSTRVVFYMFHVLTIWPVGWSSLLPYIWVCNFIWFPHRGKKERKRCSFHKKSCFFWLSTKKDVRSGG